MVSNEELQAAKEAHATSAFMEIFGGVEAEVIFSSMSVVLAGIICTSIKPSLREEWIQKFATKVRENIAQTEGNGKEQ